MELSGVSVFLLLGDEAKSRLLELLLAHGANRAVSDKASRWRCFAVFSRRRPVCFLISIG